MNEIEEKMRFQQQVALIEETAKKHLDKGALERFGNIRAVYPEKALQVAALIVQNVEAGNLTHLNDNQLKQLLLNLQESKKEFKVNRK